ncbi:MAG: SEC-C metal-binding domain-containing protein, partial [Acidimicrobiales bacterium]|nr:SEC-C metal-binding domain-containing protein [Acidimicrobiales bacterium]
AAGAIATLNQKKSASTGASETPPQSVKESSSVKPSTIVKSEFEKTGRNEPCPCESGKKFKQCHGK